MVAERACPAGARQHRAAIAIFQCAVIRPAFVLINSHIGSVPPHDEAACHTQFSAQDIFLRDCLAPGYGVRVGKSVRGVGVKGQPGVQISREVKHLFMNLRRHAAIPAGRAPAEGKSIGSGPGQQVVQ